MSAVNQKGYSLIEVVAATAVFLIAVLALCSLLMQGYRAMGLAGKRSTNLHLAQGEIEAAISSQDYSPTDPGVTVDRKDIELVVFGKKVGGTLITVTRESAAPDGAEVVYVYFLPSQGGD